MNINNDFEREHLLDYMYILEKQKEMEQEWWEWEHRKAAQIVVIKPEEHENNIQSPKTTAQ